MRKFSDVEIRRIFSANRNAAAELARDLMVTRATVSLVLSGRGKSDRIMKAARAKAVELLRDERKRSDATE